MSNSCRPIFPATAYAGDDPIKMEFAKLYRPHSTDHRPGMKATDLIVLTRTPTYTDPVPAEDFLESCSLGTCAPLVDWGPSDESIIEELGIATFMFPEILHDDDYEWGELYDTTEGIPFHTTQGERDLREQISKVHFPGEHDTHNGSREAISEEDIRRGEWVLVSAEGTYDREVGVFGRDNEEWNECLELSYFSEYDQSTDKAFFIVDNKGRPTAHNAERHEQRSALNALWNHPAQDLRVESTFGLLHGDGFTRVQEVVEKTNVLEECGIHGVECSVIATGDNFAAAICRYGGVFVPRKYQSLIGDGGDFTARLTISTEGTKYPLRVAEINRC